MLLRKITDEVHFLAGTFFMFYFVTGKEKTALLELGVSQLVPQVKHDFGEWTNGERRLDELVALHGHFDHAGAASRWKKELPEATLSGSETASKILSSEARIKPYANAMAFFSEDPFFECLYSQDEEDVFIEPVTFDRILKEGDTIDLGREVLEIYETPGHSKCSLTAFHRKSRTVLVSDSCGLLMQTGRIWPTAFLDKALYEESIRKILSLDAEHICSGHQMPFSGAKKVKRFLDKNLEAVDKYYERVSELWSELGDREAVLKKIYDDYSKDAIPAIGWVLRYGNKEMVRQVIDDVKGRG